MKHKKALAVIAAVLLAMFCLAAARFLVFTDRMVFVISNQSGVPLKDAVVLIGITPNKIGDIDAGARGRVVVHELPECSPHLQYSLGDSVHDVDLDLYLCSGMWGTIRIDVRREALVVKEQTGLYALRPATYPERAVPVKAPDAKGR